VNAGELANHPKCGGGLRQRGRGLAALAARKGQTVVNEMCVAGSSWTVYRCTWEPGGSATVTFVRGKKRWNDARDELSRA
jgi:hypothetical protein